LKGKIEREESERVYLERSEKSVNSSNAGSFIDKKLANSLGESGTFSAKKTKG